MKVKELIEFLETLDLDADVLLQGGKWIDITWLSSSNIRTMYQSPHIPTLLNFPVTQDDKEVVMISILTT